MTDKLQLRVPKMSDLAAAAVDAIRPENIAPYVACGLVFALLTNLLTAAAATAMYAYVAQLWDRARVTDTTL